MRKDIEMNNQQLKQTIVFLYEDLFERINHEPKLHNYSV